MQISIGGPKREWQKNQPARKRYERTHERSQVRSYLLISGYILFNALSFALWKKLNFSWGFKRLFREPFTSMM